MTLMRGFLPALILLASTGAFAQTPPADGAQGGRGMVRQACKADLDTYCKGVQPGGGRIKQCLQANRDKLSQGCKDAIAAMKAAKAGNAGTGAAPPQ